MSLVCSITGLPPEQPVYSPLTKCIYERRLIEKHIDTQGSCPVTNVELLKDDLLTIDAPKCVKPRPTTASSIPGLMSLFQNEWDCMATEMYTLQQHIDTLRNQLSQTLYQHDAATRVIARMLKEKDELHGQMKQLQKLLATRHAHDGTVEVETGLKDELMAEMQDLAKRLLSSRKKRKAEDLTLVDVMKQYECGDTFPVHSSASPGILCCDIFPKRDRIIVTGGVDACVVVFNCTAKKTIKKLAGHIKKINAVKAHSLENVIISASDDKTLRVWKGDENDDYVCSHIVRKHKAAVKDIDIHPLHDYFISCANDSSWGFFDLNDGKCLKLCSDTPCQYNCLSFHPDGMIVGCGGVDGAVHIWDMKGTQFRASLTGHQGPIDCLNFSENGYYLATGSQDGTVKLWDLRKSLSFQSINMENKKPAHTVTFDYSGQYIAAGSTNITLFNFESRANVTPMVTLEGHKNIVTNLKFGPNAQYLISTSMDRTVKYWSPPEAAFTKGTPKVSKTSD